MSDTLFGEIEPVKKKSRKKSVEVSDGSTQRLMDLFKQAHLERLGCPAALGTTYGHAMRILKELKQQFESEEVTGDVIRAFFASRDTRITTGGYTVKELKFHAPRLRIQLAGRSRPQDNPTTAHNLEVLERARRGRD